MLPMVRSDFATASKYVYTPFTPLDIPITTFASDTDLFAPPNAVEGWRNETTSYFSRYGYTGGHYFLVPERDSILRIVTSEMEHRYAAIQQLRAPGDPIRWIKRVESRQKPQLRLFCFPGVGGIAKDFHALAAVIPPDAELCAIELPGHGTRTDESPLGRVQNIVDHLVVKLRNHLDRPFVFLGHDLGALVMYEVMLRLRQTGGPLPQGLIVVAAMAPCIHYFAPIHHLSAEAFTATLGLFNLNWDSAMGTNQYLRADFAALANYESTATMPFDGPICAIAGEQDSFTPSTAVTAWSQHTINRFELHVLPCNHLSTLLGERALSVVRAELLNLTQKTIRA
jgi:medium-chain acyl-[acyl-carrier-protein] hydrolase